ncbi:internal scaffolding protein [Apis mellifera associated microvirus 24]|nr:internal scaffolding protein [Apis mellifera associated microvirus 24]AZL82790.1 internal scaffolding protein [Apis mellifera associated microvirus 24]AZL82855.1 internal scaffolding protein [Apis mellifera associated microvirus 24]
MPKQITKRKNGTIRVVTHNNKPSLTDQSFKDDCDINTIWSRFKKTKIWPGDPSRVGQYGDFTDVPDLLVATQRIHDAEDAFNQLPAKLRLRFNNNPLEMVQFLQDPKNLEESIQLGLRNAPKQDQKKQNPESTNVDPEPPVGKKQTSKKPKQETQTDE